MRFLGRGAGLVLLAWMLVAPARADAAAWPTGRDAGARLRAAWLVVEQHEPGRLGVSLMTPPGTLDSATATRTLAAVFGGPLARTWLRSDGMFDTFTGEVATDRAADGRQRFAVDPAPLLAELRRSGARALSIDLTLPPHTPFTLEASGDPAWDGLARGSRFTTLSVDEPHAAALVLAGFSPAARAAGAATASALLLLPWLGAAWVVLRTRRDAAQHASGAWFRGMQWLSWIVLVTFVSVVGVSIDSTLGHMTLGAAEDRFGPWGALLGAVAALVPVASCLVAVTLAQHAVASCTRGTSFTLREQFAQSAWSFVSVASLGLGCTAAVLAARSGQVPLAITALLAAFAGMALARVRAARAQGMELQAVSQGELRDRLVDLAARAGVTLRQLYVVPMRRSRMANAFAVRRDVVVLTDWLLEHLERREVDAILSHELAHLKLGHPRKLALWGIAGAGLCGVCVGEHMLAWIVPLAVVGSTLAMRFAARRYEREADAEAVRLCGDPEALIRALVRASHLNDVPIRWSRAAERTLTHPSTERRARAIGEAAGMTSAHVETLLAEAPPPRDGYGTPLSATPGGKVFSTPWKNASVGRLSLLMLACACFAPAVTLALAERLHAPRALELLAAIAVAFAGMLGVSDLLGARGVRGLRAPLARRRPPRAGAHFVGIAPGPETRIYEGFYDWDLGFLSLEPGELVYEGEETTLRIPRHAIASTALHPGPASWIGAPRIAIAWSDPAGDRAGVLLLRPANVATVIELRAASRRLAQELHEWCARTPTAAAGSPATLPPRAEDVSGVPLRRALAPATLVFPLLLAGLLSVLACALLRMPGWPGAGPGWLDTWCAAVTATVLMRVPGWRSRGREADRSPQELERAA